MKYVTDGRIAAWCACLVLVAALVGCARGETPEASGNDDVRDVDDVGVPEDVGDVGDAVANDTDADAEEGCDADADCPQGEICVRPDLGSEGQCRVVEDGGVEGDPCQESADCDTGLCLDGVCSRGCEDFDDCLEGWTCSPQGLCEAPGCAHDGNCAEGQWCAVAANDDAGALETVCLPDNGGVESGEACEEHGDCLGRYCLEGTCTAPCEDIDQCSGIDMCEQKTVEKEGLEGTFDLCQQPGFIECTAPEDCGSPDLTCNLPTYDGDVIDGASCGPTNPGQGAMGDHCTEDSQCESNLCLPLDGGASGECSVFCQNTSSHCGPEQVCLGLDDDVGLCISTCERNADCFGDDVCRFGLETSDELIRFCDAPVGDGELGDACDFDTECESGLCLSTYYPDTTCAGDANCPGDLKCGPCPSGAQCAGPQVCQLSSCSAVCVTNDDCAGDHEMTVCADDIVMTLPGGQQETVSACAP